MRELKRVSGLTIFGWVLTIAIFIGFGILLYCRRADIPGLELNEWGDMMAGFAAILAFLWLVIGYYQNTQALRLQQQELAHQVEEMKHMVEASQRQAEASERSLEHSIEIFESQKVRSPPKLAMGNGYIGIDKFTGEFQNIGDDIHLRGAELVDGPQAKYIEASVSPVGWFHKNEVGSIEIKTTIEMILPDDFNIKLLFTDKFGAEGFSMLHYKGNELLQIE